MKIELILERKVRGLVQHFTLKLWKIKKVHIKVDKSGFLKHLIFFKEIDFDRCRCPAS